MQDTNRSDLEILNVISNFFSVSFANRNLLNGLIYLHQISDPRMGRTRRLNIDMFKALCGEDAFPNVAVVTSMWSTDESSREFEKQIEREEQLSAEYLADVLSAEGLLRRVKSKDKTTIDVSSAQEIFQELFDLWKDDQITLDIQHELVNSGLRIGSTAAGKVLSSHLDKTYSAELSQLRSATKHASYAPTIPNEATDALDDDEQKALQASLAQLRADKQGMDLDLVQVHVQERKRFIAELTAIEARWRDELAEREREQAEHERMLAKRLQQQEQQEQQQQQFMAAFVREVAAQQQQQWREEQQRQREEKYREEVERMRKDLEEMRAEIQAKTETAEKAKRAWVDPLIEGAVGGGMQLVGGLITAGESYDSYHGLDKGEDVERCELTDLVDRDVVRSAVMGDLQVGRSRPEFEIHRKFVADGVLALTRDLSNCNLPIRLLFIWLFILGA